MLRKYELRETVLSCLVYNMHWYKRPCMRIMIDTVTRNMQISIFFRSVSSTEIKFEVEHILDLLDNKHWRDIVSLQSVENHPSEQYELF